MINMRDLQITASILGLTISVGAMAMDEDRPNPITPTAYRSPPALGQDAIPMHLIIMAAEINDVRLAQVTVAEVETMQKKMEEALPVNLALAADDED